MGRVQRRVVLRGWCGGGWCGEIGVAEDGAAGDRQRRGWCGGGRGGKGAAEDGEGAASGKMRWAAEDNDARNDVSQNSDGGRKIGEWNPPETQKSLDMRTHFESRSL